jgi:mono/diheme cytochrome c family protein
MRTVWPSGLATTVCVAAGVTFGSAQLAGQTTARPDVTFTKDILPILQTSCQDCHRPGGSGPMPLVTYDDVRPWARAIRQRITNREMPPWFSRRDIGEYDPDPSLSDAQIAMVSAWVDGGALPGNPSDAPPPRQFVPSGQWRFGEPDLIVTSPGVSVPAVGPDLYPEPVVDAGLTEDRFVQWMEIVPEHDPVVHHVLVYNAGNGSGGSTDSEDGGRGTLIANLAKGGTPRFFPDGAAKVMRRGDRIRFQIHLHPTGKAAEVEHTRVGIKFFPKGYVPKHIIQTRAVSSQATLIIPPGAANVQSDSFFTLEHPTTLLSFQPHMHYRGKRMTLEVQLPSGEKRLLSDIDRFTQAWQPTYRYKHPPTFPSGSTLHVTAYHDNSAANKLNPDPTAFVAWGERTVDEMNIGWMDFFYLTDEEYAATVAHD